MKFRQVSARCNKTPYFLIIPTAKDYYLCTQPSLIFVFFKLMKGATWPRDNAREKLNNEKGKVNKKFGNNIGVIVMAPGKTRGKHQKKSVLFIRN